MSPFFAIRDDGLYYGHIPAMTAVTDGLSENTLVDGFDYHDLVAAESVVRSVDRQGVCVYREQPNPTPRPTMISAAPTMKEEEIVVLTSIALSMTEESAVAVSEEGSSENEAFKTGIVQSVAAVESNDDVYDVEARAIVASRRRRRRNLLQATSSTFDVSFAVAVATGTTDEAQAAALVSTVTSAVSNDLIANVAESSTFLDALLSALATLDPSSSLGSASVDVNATLTSVANTVAFVQTAQPTAAPTAGDSKKSSKLTTTTIIIIAVVVPVGALLFLAIAGVLILKGRSINTKVQPEHLSGVSPDSK